MALAVRVAFSLTARQVLGADVGAIFLPDGEPGLVARGVHGSRSKGWEGLRLNADRGLNAMALSTGRAAFNRGAFGQAASLYAQALRRAEVIDDADPE